MNLHLLIIEDNQTLIKTWKEKLEFYEAEDLPIYKIIPTYVTELSEAKSLLLNSSFDAAVIDIRLESKDGQLNKDGNELFEIITKSSLTIAAVCTGEPEIVEIQEHQKDFAFVFEKGDGVVRKILNWLDEKASMISAIQNMQKSINAEMAKVFSQSIWPRWSYWLNPTQNQEFAGSALTRHMATHLHASFLNEASRVHPEEYYFIPPLQEQLATGDIFSMDDGHFVLVTPRCDLARQDNQSFQLVKLESIKQDWSSKNEIISNTTTTPKNKGSAERALRKMVNHGDRSAKLHFIPQIKLSNENILGPFHAQFNLMICINASTETVTLLNSQRIATLSNEFVPSLVERLGSYFSRIGTPDYSNLE